MENFKLLQRVECVSMNESNQDTFDACKRRGTIVAAGFRVKLFNSPVWMGTDLVPYVVVELDEGYYIPNGGFTDHLVCHPNSIRKV